VTVPLYVDLTTISQQIGRHPHGTTRVERGIVAELVRRQAPGIAFVVYSRAAGRFALVPAEEAHRIATAPALPERWRELVPAWRRHPLVMRARLLRRHLRACWQRLHATPCAAHPGDDPFAPGGTLLIPAEPDRQDFAHLAALKRTRGLRLAFVFYDVLQVLADGDPRLADPLAMDLPPTDFMVREASLLLAISRFSVGELRRHLARRGIAGPPVVPIRLAGQLPQDGPGTPVSGLAPGTFVLSVGDVVHRKNQALLAKVWRAWAAETADALPLVIVGRIDQEGQALAGCIARDVVLRERIRFLPNADDPVLAWLYRNCRFTVFPSLLEGFGLPVAESLAYGKVCVASTASAIPEAGQGAAIGLDPHDADAWLRTVRRLARDDRALAEHAARIARDFRPVTWRDTVDDILGALAAAGLRAGTGTAGRASGIT
jgi:glycosyltransferase involved in cell wall biosynthesis